MEVTFCPSVWRTAIPVSSSSWAEDLPSCCWRPPGSMMVSHMSLRPDEQEEPGNLCLIMKRRSLVQARYIIYEAVYSACKKGDVIDKNVQYYAATNKIYRHTYIVSYREDAFLQITMNNFRRTSLIYYNMTKIQKKTHHCNIILYFE